LRIGKRHESWYTTVNCPHSVLRTDSLVTIRCVHKLLRLVTLSSWSAVVSEERDADSKHVNYLQKLTDVYRTASMST